MKPNAVSPPKSPSASVEYAGPYRLMETIGRGGLATVKVGLEFSSGTRVAIKIINKEKLVHPREQVSMAREITIMKLLKHKNILRLYDIYENDEKIFLILDLYEGGDLYGYLTQRGAMPPDHALNFFKQIIFGLEYCHKCMIVHRDLKPENLLLSADKKRLVISDFGLSTGMQGSRNILKTRCGTVHYISPEVAKGDPYIGMPSDVWSVGIILFAMVTASLPFDGPNSIAVLKRIVRGEFSIPPYVPKELQDLLRLILTGDPRERISIHQIKQHPWFLGADETPRRVEEAPKEPYTIQVAELRDHPDILSNLKLLGWEESELMNELLDTKMNMAKTFYKLLIEHKNLPTDQVGDNDTPHKEKVPRRRSISNAPGRAVVSFETKSSTNVKTTKSRRLSQRYGRDQFSGTRNNTSTNPAAGTSTNTGTESSSGTATGTGTGSESKQQISASTMTTTANANSQPPLQPTTPRATSTVQSPKDKSKGFIRVDTNIREKNNNNNNHMDDELQNNKSVTEILEALKSCFADLGQYDISAKQTRNGLKVKARKSGKRQPVVTVNLLQREGDSSTLIIKGRSKDEREFSKESSAKKVVEMV